MPLVARPRFRHPDMHVKIRIMRCINRGDGRTVCDRRQPAECPRAGKDPDAAGSLLSNAGDYARFLEAVMADKGLSRPMAEAMREPLVPMTNKALFGLEAQKPDHSHAASGLAWCLGWIYARGPRGEMYFHIGAEGWFENFVLFIPQRQEGLVVFSSGENPAGLVRDAVKLVFGDTGLPFDWMGY